jgi:hypothetical protein
MCAERRYIAQPQTLRNQSYEFPSLDYPYLPGSDTQRRKAPPEMDGQTEFHLSNSHHTKLN